MKTPDRLVLTTAAGSYLVDVETKIGQTKVRLPDLRADETVPVLASAIEYLSSQSRNGGLVEIDNVQDTVFPLGTRNGATLTVDPREFWQLPQPWIANAAYPHPQVHVLTNGQYHPKRPRKPVGVVYERYIPWLGETLSFRTADPQTDIEHFHRWMNDEQVNLIWEDGGDKEKHTTILEVRLHDPHILALIGCFNGVPFGYFEVYWAKENRLGPYYDAQDYDRGWHVAIGEPAYRGKKWITAWLPSLMHFMFLDDPRTQRIVGEPRASHEQQIRNLDRSGFSKVKHFDFPHKRAMLVMLLRERYFDDRFWVPAP
ncbi:acetyltransferase (plasmid) [Phyllobacterium sp. 628]|nr:acetyltransferase [Phyllobacterium sp. 628]